MPKSVHQCQIEIQRQREGRERKSGSITLPDKGGIQQLSTSRTVPPSPVRREKFHSQAGVSVLCSFFCSFKWVELLTRLGCVQGLPGGTSGKEPTCQWRRHQRLGSIPRSEVSPGRGHGNPLQYSCRENPMARGAWRATVPGVTESDMT